MIRTFSHTFIHQQYIGWILSAMHYGRYWEFQCKEKCPHGTYIPGNGDRKQVNEIIDSDKFCEKKY